MPDYEHIVASMWDNCEKERAQKRAQEMQAKRKATEMLEQLFETFDGPLMEPKYGITVDKEKESRVQMCVHGAPVAVWTIDGQHIVATWSTSGANPSRFNDVQDAIAAATKACFQLADHHPARKSGTSEQPATL